MDHHDSPAMRFAPYVAEVRDHLRAREMPVGSPDGLLVFTDRLHVDAAFRDEMGSILRSIAYREEQHIGAAELAWIQCWSITNAEPDQLPAQYDAPLKALLRFALEALRPLRAGTATTQDAPAPAELPAQPASLVTNAGASVPSITPELPHAAAAISLPISAAELPPADSQGEPHTNDRLSRALYQNATEIDPREPRRPSATTTVADAPPERLQPRPGSNASARHAEPRTFMSVLRLRIGFRAFVFSSSPLRSRGPSPSLARAMAWKPLR